MGISLEISFGDAQRGLDVGLLLWSASISDQTMYCVLKEQHILFPSVSKPAAYQDS